MAIAYELTDGVAEIRFDRPEKLNALTLDMYEQLGQAWTDARDDPAVRAVLLTGAGDRAFCVGADLEESIPALASRALRHLPVGPRAPEGHGFYKPIVAAVNGLCLGGGFEILLATDIRIAARPRASASPSRPSASCPRAGRSSGCSGRSATRRRWSCCSLGERFTPTTSCASACSTRSSSPASCWTWPARVPSDSRH